MNPFVLQHLALISSKQIPIIVSSYPILKPSLDGSVSGAIHHSDRKNNAVILRKLMSMYNYFCDLFAFVIYLFARG